jgi:hypothetical protein
VRPDEDVGAGCLRVIVAEARRQGEERERDRVVSGLRFAASVADNPGLAYFVAGLAERVEGGHHVQWAEGPGLPAGLERGGT